MLSNNMKIESKNSKLKNTPWLQQNASYGSTNMQMQEVLAILKLS